MASSPLRQFISHLESTGELSRIAVPVNPVLEIAAITNRVCKGPNGGTALLFDHPAGSDFPVATNLFGSPERVCRALGVTQLHEISDRLSGLLGQIPACDQRPLDHQIADLPGFSRFFPETTADPDPELVTMNPPDLNRFPFLQSWPGDGDAEGHGRYITLPQIFTADPDGGTRNCGVYRVQLRGMCEVAIQWKEGSGAARHVELHRQSGKAMPVAIVLGGDPATLFSAMFPLPGDCDELTFSGFMRGAPLATAPCQSVPLHVPTGAEVVIEGYVTTEETVIEGPFGNHTGSYSPAAPAALMRVTAIRHRPDAIIPATVVGPPPMEDCWMAQAWEAVLLPFLQKRVPDISAIHFPFEWTFHQSAIISLEKPRPGMVRNISSQLLELPWFTRAKILVFVASDGHRPGLSHAAWKAINVVDVTQDIFHDAASGRVVVDATGCRAPRQELDISAESAALITQRWKEYGLA